MTSVHKAVMYLFRRAILFMPAPGTPPSGTFTGAKFTLTGTSMELYVGPASASSATNDIYPPCNSSNAITVTWSAGAAPNNNIVVLFFQITDLKSGTLKHLRAALNRAVFLFTKGHKMHPGVWNFVFQTKSK